MPTTFANTINGNDILAKRAVQDKNGDDIDQTYAKSAGLATVATSGSYSDLSNTPSIPTDTSDLNNDSGFITASDVPANQTQADWTESDSSDPAYIQNKPTIPSGSDLVPPYTLPTDEGKVLTVGPSTTYWSTPAAGGVTDVEVDGVSVVSQGVASITTPTVDQTYDGTSANAQSGIAVASAISNKQDTISDLATIRSGAADGATAVQPGDLATVATSGLYSDLSGTPTINNVPAVTSSDDNKVLKASYTGGVGSYSWEQESGGTVTDVEVDGTSVVSGGVASITMPTELVPTVTSNDDGKVLKATYTGGAGSYSWEAESGGTVTDVEVNGTSVVSGGVADITIPAQVQADWAEADNTAVSYIENKPVPKTLVAGTGITITETANDLTVAATAASYTAGTGISISAQNVITNTGVAINKTTPELCGSFMGEPVYTKLYEFTGTVGTSDTTVNFTIDEVVATSSTVTRIWLDPSNSFIEYGSASVKLPLTYFLSSARHGSVFVVSQGAGTLSYRGVDTSSVGLTFFLAVKYTDPTP